MNEQHVSLDISKSQGVTQMVRIGQGDKSGTTIVATVYDNGTAFDMTGMTAKFLMRTPGNGYVEDEHVNVSGNTLTYVVDEEHCAATAGVTDECYFQILQGETVIASTARFTVRILRAATQGADPAQSYSDDIVSATNAARQAATDAREAMEEIGTAVEDAAQAAESAAQAVQDAQTAVEDADTAKREATSAANAATAAANNANSKANAANTAANAANAAAQTTAQTTARAEAAIDAMGDISEQAVPVMSADIRGGARIQPDSGLEITDTDNLQVRLALESDGTVRGGIAELTAKGHAEQVSTTGKNLLPTIAQTRNGITWTIVDGVLRFSGTAEATYAYYYPQNAEGQSNKLSLSAGTYAISGAINSTSGVGINVQVTLDGTALLPWNSSSGSFTLGSASEVLIYYNIVGLTVGTSYSGTAELQLELGSTATEYEPYTGGAPSPSPEFPQTIEVVRGRNLLDESIITDSSSWQYRDLQLEPNTTYVMSTNLLFTTSSPYMRVFAFNSSRSADAWSEVYDGHPTTIQTNNDGIVRIQWQNQKSVSMRSFWYQLTLGSTPQPYVPYGHVGMEARDPDTDELISCTALPLPQRGWVAGLPDGTADTLRLDGAGKCEWTLPTSEVVLDGTINKVSSVAVVDSTYQAKYSVASDAVSTNNAFLYATHFIHTEGWQSDGRGLIKNYRGDSFYMLVTDDSFSTVEAWNAWLQSNPVTVLYPLATPVTEDCGYVEDWPTDIPEGCVIDIPELSEVGIKFFIDSSVTELAKQWYARANSEYEDRLTALEQAVAELVTS